MEDEDNNNYFPELPHHKYVNIDQQKHPFHVLSSSKLPIFIATFAGIIALVFIAKIHNLSVVEVSRLSTLAAAVLVPFFSGSSVLATNGTLFFLVILLVGAMWCWALNLIKESTAEGHHTLRVQSALKYGMILFLLSEAMLFFPFFWSFFHGSFAPGVDASGIWPPVGIKNIETLNPTMLPAVNTLVLLSSVIALVAAHRAIIFGNKKQTSNMLYVASSLGIFLSWLQFLEYGLTQYTINDSLFGSVFFMLTGLHGFHVIVGTCLLLISYWRTVNSQFSTTHHIGFEASAWYWHSVDVVWLFVYGFVHIWCL